MEKRKIYGTIIGGCAFVILLIGVTYAYFYWGTNDENKTNVNLTVSKNLEPLIVYNAGTSILDTENRTLELTDSYIEGASATIEFWKKSHVTTPLYGQISLNLLKLLSSTGTTDANIGKTNTMKWTITTYNVNDSTEMVVNEGSFNGKRQGDKFAITENFELNNYQTYYKIYLWVDSAAIVPGLSITGEVITTEISASASDVNSHYGTYPLNVIKDLGLNNLVVNSTPDFSAISNSSTSVIYPVADDFGGSFVFRGNITNNYVKFAGYFWRIIRINGDGSIRMIYDGTEAHTNGSSSTDRRMTTSEFKTSPYNSNTYIGYMYGAIGDTYAVTHTNDSNSTIKTTVDNWYKTNIVDKGYSSYVVDAIYCNDRSLVSGSGIGTDETTYGAYGRLYTNKIPSLVCSQAIDKFTTSTTLGNGKLTYPVGLITADEVALAGGVYGTANNTYYLYTGNYYYTMSAYNFTSSTGNIFGVNAAGTLTFSNNYTGYGVRPVISIRSDAITGGTGISTDPFVTISN